MEHKSQFIIQDDKYRLRISNYNITHFQVFVVFPQFLKYIDQIYKQGNQKCYFFIEKINGFKCKYYQQDLIPSLFKKHLQNQLMSLNNIIQMLVLQFIKQKSKFNNDLEQFTN
ncbi:unnamed protein product [Paramecium pentaurelia]|uniref:Uncharacterized protein n=1 Tax=Paramecium pentaurelia TaxID=43138 RepID=A0A8S1TE43_9CILI|nr:unnamed protein product [Paramecium pentaurelia]